MTGVTLEQPADNLRTIRYGNVIPQIESFRTAFYEETKTPYESEKLDDFYKLSYISQGWQIFTLDRKSYYLPMGHLLLVKPGHLSSTGDLPKENNRIFTVKLRVPPNESSEESYIGYSRKERDNLFRLINRHKGPVLFVPSRMGPLFEEINELSRQLFLWDEKNDGNNLILTRVKNCYRELLVLMAEGTDVFSNALDSMIDSLLPRLPEGGYSALVVKAIGHMSEHLYGGLTLVSLADGVNISMSRFKAKFKEDTGLTPLEYYSRLSIQRGMILLHGTDKSITYIARELGYSSSQYFSTVFKKITGLTPGDFREWKERTYS